MSERRFATGTRPGPTDGRPPEFHAALILCVRRRWAEAETAFGALASAVPGETIHHVYHQYAKARVLLQAGAVEVARRHLDAALALHPDFAPAQRTMAAIDAMSGASAVTIIED